MGKSIDVVGQKFNKLTVTKDLRGGKILATCDCGSIKEYYKSNVMRGSTKSCGCLEAGGNFKSRVGQTFGMLTVLEDLGDNKVIAQCKCGTVKEFVKSSVVHGGIKNCGCENPRHLALKDRTGQKFNMLTVLKELGNNVILVRCDCGVEFECTKTNVISGGTRSCGCIRKGASGTNIQIATTLEGVSVLRRTSNRLINRVGEKFGSLTITEELGKDKVTARCDCGTERVYVKSRLVSGSNKSCGCKRVRDVVGERFGKLVVLDDNHNGVLTVRCDCGVERTASRNAVVSGHTKSCGCGSNAINRVGQTFNGLTIVEELPGRKVVTECVHGRLEEHTKSNVLSGKIKGCSCKRVVDITGQRFGKLVVIEMPKGRKVIAKCDCGNIKEFTKGSLVNGNTRSCGCTNIVRKSRLGEKFSKLTIVEELGHDKVICRCDCGNVREYTKSQVVCGVSKHCGCLRRRKHE